MGGQLPTIPTDPHEPTVADWDAFMTAVATAPSGAIVSMVVQDATGNPTVADFRIPVEWIKVSPRFAITPPVVQPPIPPVVTPPQTVTLYVVSTNGVFLHSKTDTTIDSRIVETPIPLKYKTLTFGATVKVNPDTTTANGYVWRIITAGEPNAGLFVAEKSSDGATVILSSTAPGK